MDCALEERNKGRNWFLVSAVATVVGERPIDAGGVVYWIA